jgi:GcrA cell cycle regulator
MTGSNGLIQQPRPGQTPLWSEERINHLTTLWSQGLSARQISRELGSGISRSSVLAKIHRLGIGHLSPNGGRRWSRPARIERPPAPAGAIAIVPRPVWLFRPNATPAWVANAVPYVDDPLADADIPRAQRRSLLQLNYRTCRWPVGDPARSDFFFCGAVSVEGEAYCAAHCARAIRPAEQAAQRDAHAPEGAPSRAPTRVLSHASLGARLRRTMRALRDMDKFIGLGGEGATETQSEEGA